MCTVPSSYDVRQAGVNRITSAFMTTSSENWSKACKNTSFCATGN